ncbi:MAG: ATP-binding protein, partial [Dokdonella sp.]
ADNSEQQRRVSQLQGIVVGRARLLDQAMAQLAQNNYDGAGNALSQARELFAFREVGQGILDTEEALFIERSANTLVVQRNANWATLGALAAQLVLLGSVIFISERQIQRRQRAESQVQHAIARSRAIVQTVREPIVVVDDALRVVMSNAAFREVYANGRDEEASIGEPLERVGAGAWSDPVLAERLTEVGRRNRELWDYELTQRIGDEVERIVLVNARPMLIPESSQSTILMTVADITARKRAQAQILELNRDLEGKIAQISEVNRELESFSYSVSHDLRAPLRHIAGFADKLGTHLGEGADEKAHHYLEVIGSSARRMSTLIEDLLLYSRLGRSALRLQPVDSRNLVEQVRAIVLADAGERQIEWRIGELPYVIGDETMLRQVWQNLLGNAVKYTARRTRAEIEIGVEKNDEKEIVFFVRDNGTGFDMDYAGKLFGVFQRLHKPSDFPGTGIGLANVRRIIGRHGGRTWAQAAPDKGATFYFSMPDLVPVHSAPEVSA